ncbi:MAG TPA: hypothetical protein ENK14_10830, partial [Caldithrix sp.]|nr:hypothetical protein [Caldithrix sp.]
MIAVLPVMVFLANASELTGLEIMEKVLNKTSWKDMQGNVKLVLTNSRGEQRVREIRMFNRKRTENENDMR